MARACWGAAARAMAKARARRRVRRSGRRAGAMTEELLLCCGAREVCVRVAAPACWGVKRVTRGDALGVGCRAGCKRLMFMGVDPYGHPLVTYQQPGCSCMQWSQGVRWRRERVGREVGHCQDVS